MGQLILVTGGARSGKSSFAEELATRYGAEQTGYIATARAFDEEMVDRISRHKQQRPQDWVTWEAHLNPSAVLTQAEQKLYLLDCLTVLTTNIILAAELSWDTGSLDTLPTMEERNRVEEDVLAEIERIIAAVHVHNLTCIAVTNEVGSGIVPADPLARFFRDCTGRVNQRMASAAEHVWWVVSGIPVQIKGQV